MPFYQRFQANPMQSRADFQEAALALFEPLIPYLQRQGARIDFDEGGASFDMQSSSVEGVVRPLWGLVPLAMGGGERAHWPLLRQALSEGVDPAHPNYWGPVHDYSQRAVEMAAIGMMLMLLPEEGWYPLEDSDKHNLVAWIDGIQRVELVDNNWLFFAILVQEGLRRIGKADLVDETLQERYLARIEEWYLGDGWYGDGPELPIDHYNGFAMHFYALLYVQYGADADSARCRRFRQRAGLFAVEFAQWFAESGETVMVGRSLIYRFATAAFWGIAATAEQDQLSIGAIKGIWARQIRSWRNLPIFTSDGLLTRGYSYPNLIMSEEYNSPTSPYWAMKAFFPLAFSEHSDFWHAEEEPLPVSRELIPMQAASSIIQRSGDHAILHYAAPVRSALQRDKYNKFAYSTLFGPDMASLHYSERFSFGDNILAFSFDDGLNWTMCHARQQVRITDDRVRMRWLTGRQEVDTTVTPGSSSRFQRRHSFTLDAPALVVETGFAVSEWYHAAQVLDPQGVFHRSDQVSEAIKEQRGRVGMSLTVRGENGISGIESLDELPKIAVLGTRIHTNISSPKTVVPFLLAQLEPGSHELNHAFTAKPADAYR
ncbi:DUF2264 domain-containing protein [Paracoccus sediminilitoris]|uniref:DUF2264 domain-containing protein n=1 Tax=Paracoccus sediminilitoris TaxID=2202419 RepID=UPI000DBA90DF|nr:DUF2264 domain-containing protein [Paracoccus sediminilitoris]